VFKPLQRSDNTAQLLARAAKGTITFGYLGVPPGRPIQTDRSVPKNSHPNGELRLQELPFRHSRLMA